jgi:mannonate dehydratase
MAEPQWQGRLFGDISAITMLNRDINVLKTLLTETAWHNRLLYGSDYPLPAVLPLISARDFAHEGLLPEAAVAPLEALQDYHALRFDFVLKRHLSWQGKRFGDSVFATRQFFT